MIQSQFSNFLQKKIKELSELHRFIVHSHFKIKQGNQNEKYQQFWVILETSFHSQDYIEVDRFQFLNMSLAAKLVNPFAGGRTPSDAQLKSYVQAFQVLTQDISQTDRALCQTHVLKYQTKNGKFRDYCECLQGLRKKIGEWSAESQKRIVELKSQSASLLKKIKEFEQRKGQEKSILLSQIAQDEKLFIQHCEQRIQLASNINLSSLEDVDIQERKSPAHRPFRWMLVTLYCQPESKYYWDNFKEQVLESQKGVDDLRQRLGKVSAMNTTEEQRLATAKFISEFEQTRKSQELQDYYLQIKALYEIAEIFLKCTQIAKRIKENKEAIKRHEKHSESSLKQHNQLLEDSSSLSERIKVTQFYHNQIRFIGQRLQEKIQLYKRQSITFQKFLSSGQISQQAKGGKASARVQ